eukprot:5646172-Prymnesium_polylepis.2
MSHHRPSAITRGGGRLCPARAPLPAGAHWRHTPLARAHAARSAHSIGRTARLAVGACLAGL